MDSGVAGPAEFRLTVVSGYGIITKLSDVNESPNLQLFGLFWLFPIYRKRPGGFWREAHIS